MKKFLLGTLLTLLLIPANLVLAQLAPPTIFDLVGEISVHGNKPEKLEKVIITMNEEMQGISEEGGKYEIFEFSENLIPHPPLTNNSARISFSKDGYKTITINIIKDGVTYYVNDKSNILKEDPKNKDTYRLDFAMAKDIRDLITGTALDDNGNPMKNVTVRANPIGGGKNQSAITNVIGGYTIRGIRGDHDYKVTFEHNAYQMVELPNLVTTTADATAPVSGTDVTFVEKSSSADMENDIEAITGFGCDDLMPKYLVGANCVDNKNLKGDASDVTNVIQKFGSKLTTLMGVIAVLMIIWNAFKIATAAGETEKIAEGNKRILWTVLGLAAAMFAYVVVKTVIILTYVQ